MQRRARSALAPRVIAGAVWAAEASSSAGSASVVGSVKAPIFVARRPLGQSHPSGQELATPALSATYQNETRFVLAIGWLRGEAVALGARVRGLGRGEFVGGSSVPCGDS